MAKMMRHVLAPVVLAAGLVAAHAETAGATALRAADGGTPRRTELRFTAVGFASGPYDVLTGDFHTAGAFVATHIGPGLVTADSDPNAGFTAVETTLNGDRIYITNDPSNPGGPLPTNCPTNASSGPYSGGEFITGGTGRFAHSAGYITYSGCSSVYANPHSPTGYTFAFTYLDKATITS